MNIQMEDFQTGWQGISISLSPSEIDRFVEALQDLRNEKHNHFHFRSSFPKDQASGVADIEFSLIGEQESDNATID